MATTYYEAEDCYAVAGSSASLRISVECGDGQGCGFLIFIGSELLSANTEASIPDPDGSIGQWITVSATVKDKLTETNWTSITVFVRSGEILEKFGPYKREVAEHLDTVIFTVKIKIVL